MHKHFIIGLGWLGSPLSAYLKAAGDSVAGTTRDEHKAQLFSLKGTPAYLFDLYQSDINILPKSAINDANVIINIPPGRREFSYQKFVERMKALFNFVAQNNAKHICFISTTSVFAGSLGRICNHSPFSPNTDSGKAHVELELYLKSMATAFNNENDQKTSMRVSVLRLAGLVNADRHPITSLSNKSDITLGKDPVNLIHQQDVIRVISALLNVFNNKDATAPFFAGNLCSSEHPSRETYYPWCAEQLGIRAPAFAKDTRVHANGKFIDATETLKKLNIKLDFSSPYQMLPLLP